MFKNKRIAVVIPAYNEEGKIGSTVRKLKDNAKYIDKVVVVNDGSKDNTAKEAHSERSIVINHKVNQGVGAALRSGYFYCLKNDIDIIVTMGGDDQDDPTNILNLITPIINEGFDFVQGSRYLSGVSLKQPWFRYLTTKIYSFVFSLAAMKVISDGSNGFRAFKSELVDKVNMNQEWLNHYELEPYFLLKVIKKGFKFKEVGVVKYWHKGKGYSKMVPFKSWWSISKPLFLSFLEINQK